MSSGTTALPAAPRYLLQDRQVPGRGPGPNQPPARARSRSPA